MILGDGRLTAPPRHAPLSPCSDPRQAEEHCDANTQDRRCGRRQPTTAGDFLEASVPDQVKAVKTEVAANPDCQGIDPKAGGEFQVAVAIDAASAPSDTPLSEIVGGQCSEN